MNSFHLMCQHLLCRLPDSASSDQDLLDWFNNELGGTTVELPWTEGDSSVSAAAAAAAAAAGMGFQQSPQQQQQQDEVDGVLDDLFAAAGGSSSSNVSNSILDDLLQNAPPQSAAVKSTSSSSSGGFARSRPSPERLTTDQGFEIDVSESGDESASVLSVIQSALKSGVAPDQLKALIDAAAAESAAAGDEVDLLLNKDTAAASAAAAAARAQPPGPAKPQQQQQQQQRQYGPSPPSAGDEEGLVNLRPEVEAAFENKQVSGAGQQLQLVRCSRH
jgi:hypothetical protein